MKDIEKEIRIPIRNSSSPRRRTASSGASRQAFSLYVPSGKGLLHQFSKDSLRSASSRKNDKSLRKKIFSSVSSRNATTTGLNDSSAQSAHGSSNEEDDLRSSSLVAELTVPPKIYDDKSHLSSSELSSRRTSPAANSNSPDLAQGLTSPTRRNRKTSNSASSGLHKRDTSDETDWTGKVAGSEESQEAVADRALGSHQVQHQVKPSESAKPQLTPPIESASHEGHLQASQSYIEERKQRSPTSDGAGLSLHTAPSSLGLESDPRSNESLQALQREQMRQEEEEVERIMREAKAGLSINLSEEGYVEPRPSWAIAEEKRLGKSGEETPSVQRSIQLV